jgi:hypothetical protein
MLSQPHDGQKPLVFRDYTKIVAGCSFPLILAGGSRFFLGYAFFSSLLWASIGLLIPLWLAFLIHDGLRF